MYIYFSIMYKMLQFESFYEIHEKYVTDYQAFMKSYSIKGLKNCGFIKKSSIFVTSNYKNIMNKSATQKVFISKLPEGTTKEQAWDLFVAEYGDNFVRKGDFNHVFKCIITGEITVKPELMQTENQTVHSYSPTEVKVEKMSDLKKDIDPAFLVRN